MWDQCIDLPPDTVPADGLPTTVNEQSISQMSMHGALKIKKSHWLASQITSPLNNKLVFLNKLKDCLKKTTIFCWIGKLPGKPVTPLYLKSSMGLLMKNELQHKFCSQIKLSCRTTWDDFVQTVTVKNSTLKPTEWGSEWFLHPMYKWASRLTLYKRLMRECLKWQNGERCRKVMACFK